MAVPARALASLPAPAPAGELLFVGGDAEDALRLRGALAGDSEPRYSCAVARSLQEAQARAARSVPDIVVFDASSPDISGPAGARELQSLFRGATLIALVADGDEPLARALLQQGVHDYLWKSELSRWLVRSLRHIRERQLSERQRQLYEEQLRESERLQSLGQLASGVAHEINTPAQYIGDNLAFLQRALRMLTEPLACAGRVTRAEPAEREAAIEELSRALSSPKIEYALRQAPLAIEEAAVGVETVAAFVCSLAQFAQPGDGRRIPTDLARVLDTSLNVTRNTWRLLADSRTEYAPGLPLLSIDPSELTQVFVNLIRNAADALGARLTPAKGTLTVGTRRTNHSIEAWVSDDGVGIAPEDLPRIFDPFFTTKPPGTALGRGLTVARHIVQAGHGGEIRVESTPGKGATFVVSLPLPNP
ncbi:MAG TPA: ATP-binding protein [Polyangiaceae bacterium]|nr:ATP-binding protein [Polyangiaceae bacterium]